MNELSNIIIENENLIYSIISKYQNYFELEDLYQVGVIGLINAYKNYQKEKNTKFTSYAYFYIKGEVKKYIRESNYIKISRELIKVNASIEKAKNVLYQRLQREPTTIELSFFLEIDEKTIFEAQNASQFIERLDNDDNEISNKYGYIEQKYDERIIDLKNEISKLTKEEQQIILSRYEEGMTQQEVSKLLGINQTKISRSEKDILVRLRKRLE